MKKKIFATLLAATTVLSLIGCGDTENKSTETTETIIEETETFEDYKENMNTHVAYFAPIEEGSTKKALSIVTKTTKEVVDNVNVELQLKDATEKDIRTIDATSCAVYVNDNYYILTYALLNNVETFDECEYVVSKYEAVSESDVIVENEEVSEETTEETSTTEESLETEEVAEETESTEAAETATEDVAATEEIQETESEATEPESFILELKEDESVLESLNENLLMTDDGNLFFLQMSYYYAQYTEEQDTKLSYLFLMHPVTGYYEDFDASKFSLVTIEETPADILENYAFSVEKYDESLYGKDVYFNSLYPCLSISVVYDAEEIDKAYGEEAEAITNNCISYLGIKYEGEEHTFTYVPSKDELTYEGVEVETDIENSTESAEETTETSAETAE